MDFSTLITNERMIEIVHPKSGEPTGIKVSILAMQDPKLKKIRRRILDDKLRLEARGKNFKAEDVEDNVDTLLINAMTGWDWGKDVNGEEATFKGAKPDFTPAKIREVFRTLPWFMNQIDEAVGDEKAFF